MTDNQANEQMEMANQAVEWRVIGGFDNYEVSNTGLVRNRRTRLVLSPHFPRGYPAVVLNPGRHDKKVHKLVATAFIGDSAGRVVDHRDRDPTNNHVSNLRYTTQSNNCRNKSSNKGVIYNFADTLPDDTIIVENYGNHRFHALFYVPGGEFFVFNGMQYRGLPHLTQARTGSIFVSAYDTTGAKTQINLAKYRRMINDMP